MTLTDLINPPDRFVSLHSHSTFSTFDGLGYPADHINFVLSESQGMDSWALTDHGNGNGLAHAHSHAVKMQKAGKKFRQIYGVEFYFVPSLDQWTEDYAAHRQAIKDAKTSLPQWGNVKRGYMQPVWLEPSHSDGIDQPTSERWYDR